MSAVAVWSRLVRPLVLERLEERELPGSVLTTTSCPPGTDAPRGAESGGVPSPVQPLQLGLDLDPLTAGFGRRPGSTGGRPATNPAHLPDSPLGLGAFTAAPWDVSGPTGRPPAGGSSGWTATPFPRSDAGAGFSTSNGAGGMGQGWGTVAPGQAMPLIPALVPAAEPGPVGSLAQGNSLPGDPHAPGGKHPPQPPPDLAIPTDHPRVWWTPDSLASAQNWYASHPFNPAPSDPWGNALRYVLTGETRYGQQAVQLLMNFTISDSELRQVSVDTYRWGDWVPVVYDWCFDQLTPDQQQTFMDRYNYYTDVILAKPWGGPTMPGNNYFWGYWRNEVNWAIATWYENPNAQGYLDDALTTRWERSFLPFAATAVRGGVTPEGSQYGRYMQEYPVVPFVTLKNEGRDLMAETNWYQEALVNQIYTTSPAPTHIKGDTSAPYYQAFPFGDDETFGGYPSAATTYQGDFMTMVADEWPDQPVGEYARQWLDEVQPPVSAYVAATDPGGDALDLGNLPLDYYAPGNQFLYSRSSWDPSATSLVVQMGKATSYGHEHHDIGSFQLWRNGYYVSKESTGYAMTFNGGTDATTNATNGILFSSYADNPVTTASLHGGEANAYPDGPAQVLRLESAGDYAYAAVDLSRTYRAHASSHQDRDDNKDAGSAVREFLFIKPLETLVVLDRLSSTNEVVPADQVDKTFVMHFPYPPQVDGNSLLAVNGDQAVRVTSLLTPAPNWNVIDEGDFTGHHDVPSYYQYRLEETTSGAQDSYFLHVIQARGAAGADLNVQLAEDDTSWTVTLDHPTLGHAVAVFNKGLTSAGGAVGYSPTGTPDPQPLRDSVEPIRVTNDGPIWG